MQLPIFLTAFIGICCARSQCCFSAFIESCLTQQHPDILEHDLNECSHSSTYDEENKSWFALMHPVYGQFHLPHPVSTINTKYYVSDVGLKDSTTTWHYGMSFEEGETIKGQFVNSILKWNNVSFYQNAYIQTITKKRIINLIEGSANDYNVIICPEKRIDMEYSNSAAETGVIGSPSFSITENTILHRHYDAWKISLNIESNNNPTALNRRGAHEFGHVLGLKDIDLIDDPSNYHHPELLMGYGGSSSQTEITYKDLAGAAITRGYHTDNDHIWMYDANSSTSGNYKLMCSICNGVNYVTSLNDYTYVTYKACLDNHSLSSGNMFAVASYQNKDYYKCKYCRYVAPFTDNVTQNYSKTNYDNTNHLVTNQVTGLSYSFYETHDFTDHYTSISNSFHNAYCECGGYVSQPHAIIQGSEFWMHGHRYANCCVCNQLIDLTNGYGFIIVLSDDALVTDNGSYILPDGIYYLVEEDLEDYINGNLVFHPYGQIGI